MKLFLSVNDSVLYIFFIRENSLIDSSLFDFVDNYIFNVLYPHGWIQKVNGSKKRVLIEQTINGNFIVLLFAASFRGL